MASLTSATAAPLISSELDRRIERIAASETRWHLACPTCDRLIVPLDGLLIDRMIRLVEHMQAAHMLEAAYLMIAVRHCQQAKPDPASYNPSSPLPSLDGLQISGTRSDGGSPARGPS